MNLVSTLSSLSSGAAFAAIKGSASALKAQARESHTSARAMNQRQLIVNADDFGQSRGVNRGIITAHRDGIVTSASLMVRWPAVADAAAYARRHSNLSVGLHIDLGEQIMRGGEWVPLYSVVPVQNESAETDPPRHSLRNARLRAQAR